MVLFQRFKGSRDIDSAASSSVMTLVFDNRL